ncbi:MAG: uroporphyrinogen-III C-methyltransferase, partial [Cereibacter changlensis]
ADERIVAATLQTLPEAAAALSGPAILLYGLAPRRAALALPQLKEALA